YLVQGTRDGKGRLTAGWIGFFRATRSLSKEQDTDFYIYYYSIAIIFVKYPEPAYFERFLAFLAPLFPEPIRSISFFMSFQCDCMRAARAAISSASIPFRSWYFFMTFRTMSR